MTHALSGPRRLGVRCPAAYHRCDRAVAARRGERAATLMIVHSLKVLVVEDSTVLAERMREVIAQIPELDVVATVDGEAAAIAEIARRRVHVVLLDLHLKQGSGFGILRAMSDLCPKPHVLVITNHDSEQYKRNAIALGATHFLDKAHYFEQLPDILRRVAAGSPA